MVKNVFLPLIIFAELSILDVWQGSKYASAVIRKTFEICSKSTVHVVLLKVDKFILQCIFFIFKYNKESKNCKPLLFV